MQRCKIFGMRTQVTDRGGMEMWQWLKGLLGKPSKLSVVKELQRQIRAHGGTDIVYDEAVSEIRYSVDGAKHTTNVGNVYFDVLQAPRAKRREIIARFVASMFPKVEDEMPARYEDARPRILPIVRTLADDATGILMSARLGDPGTDAPSPKVAARPLTGELIAALAWDTPNAMQRISEAKLSEWGISFEQAMDNALENLRGLPEHGAWRDHGNGLWSGEWGDSYESSRVLLPDLIHRLGVQDPVALMPLRFTLLIASARNEKALGAMASTAKKLITENSRWLSLRPIVLTDSGWQPFEPPASCFADFDALRQTDLAETYAGQKELIENIFEKSGTDVFVAKATLMQRKGESTMVSYSVWTEGVDTLLPQTDLVIFVPAGRQDSDPLVSVPWDAACSVAGQLMTPTEYFPPRYRVQSFPQDEPWQRLLELAHVHAAKATDGRTEAA